MNQQLWINLVVGLIGPGTIGLIILAIIKLRENRTTLRFGYEAQQAGQEARWNAAYRAAAENHLLYDIERDRNIYELRSVVDHLLQRLGDPPMEWSPLRPPPPLFPNLQSQEVKT
jgi:hypothetical protein